jgi:hypothetical protein
MNPYLLNVLLLIDDFITKVQVNRYILVDEFKIAVQ